MHGVAEGIENGGVFIWNRRIEPPHVVLRNRNVFGKRAVAIDPDDFDSLADVSVAGPAEEAREIGDVSLRRNSLADANRAYRIADRRDRSHELVSDDDWRLDAVLRPRIPCIDMVVGSAKAGLLDGNQHVGRANRGYRDLGQAKTGPGARFDQRHH